MNHDLFEDGYYLGQASDTLSLVEQIALLDEDDIMAVSEENIAHRGYAYYHSGEVRHWEEKENRILALVNGSYNNHYEVMIFVDENDMLGICSCPYDDTCKHIVATLLQVNHQAKDGKNKKLILDEEVIFAEQLNRMGKSELVDLVLKFAPSNFRKSIVLKHVSKDDVDISLEKIEHLISKTLKSNEFMYDPDGLYVASLAYLDELAAHMHVAPLKTFEIVLYMIKEIQILEEEGYLYQDSCHWYSEENGFEYDTFSDKILQMIQSVEMAQEQSQIFLKYIAFCEKSDYFYCDYDKIQIKDKSLLLHGLSEIKNISFYNYIKALLSYEEKLEYLRNFDADRVVPEMVDVYLDAGNKEKAIAFVESLLAKRFKTDDAELLLQLIPVNQMDQGRLYTLLESAITGKEYFAETFVLTHIESLEEKSKLEAVLKKHRIHWYYDYLKKHERVEEMHDILGQVSNEKKDFYHRYKKRYPDEAIGYYKANINENLEFTGNSYYEAIAYYLRELKPLLSKEEFSNIVLNLKTHYKRRRNFIKILEERF